MKRRRKAYQSEMFDNEALYSHRQAAIFVGEFFEHLTAIVVKGDRLSVDDIAGENPDIETDKGEQVESKAAGYARWLVRQDQLATFCLRPAMSYVFWRYSYQQTPLIKTCKTKGMLCQHLAASVEFGFRISASLLPQVVTLDRKYLYEDRPYVEIKGKSLLDLFKHPPKAARRTSKKENVTNVVHGIRVLPHTFYTMLDGSKPEVIPF